MDEFIDEGQFNQMMLERQQRLEEAFDRAYNGFATEEDWAVLRFECGLPALQRKENHVSDSES